MLYQFNSFSLDTNKQCLIINGKPIPDCTRIAKFISCLIEAYPEPIKKNFLHQHLWHDSVVSDASITRLVADTRKLFKEHGFAGELIQTLHGQGYRLATELYEELAHPHSAEATLPGVTLANPQKQKRLFIWPLFFAVVLVVSVSGLSSAFKLFKKSEAESLAYGEPLSSVGRILWVDDNVNNNTREKRILEQHLIGVYTTTNTDDAMSLLAIYHYDVIISDMGRQQDPMAGLKLLQKIRQSNNQTAFYLYTVVSPNKLEELLHQYGGQGVATEPLQLFNMLKKHFTQVNISNSSIIEQFTSP